MKKRHYTLIEILCVTAIIAILAGSALGVTSCIQAKNAQRNTETAMKLIEMALEKYKEKHGSYPDNIVLEPKTAANVSGTLWECFNDVTFTGTQTSGIRGVITKNENAKIYLHDGWGKPFVYKYPGVMNKQGYDLGSLGPDGKWGDEAAVPVFTNDKYTLNETYFGKGDDVVNFRVAE